MGFPPGYGVYGGMGLNAPAPPVPPPLPQREPEPAPTPTPFQAIQMAEVSTPLPFDP